MLNDQIRRDNTHMKRDLFWGGQPRPLPQGVWSCNNPNFGVSPTYAYTV